MMHLKSLTHHGLLICGFWVLAMTAGTSGSVFAQDDPFASGVRPTDPLPPEEEQKALKVPPGFRIELFAAEPQILKPINMAFDARGRLWVSNTQDYPYHNLDQPSDSIRILEDTDGDGRADKVTTFVENITIPIGLYPYRDGVIAYAIPNITFYRDTDGDGVCDTQEVLLGPFDFSRDTHGMQNAFRRGFDGWIYACHGFNNNSKVTSPDGNTVEMSSGNTYRFRTDGSRIEHYTWGQVNPFGMSFDSNGDIFTSDCHSKPIMMLIKDGYFPSFGRPHDGLGFVPNVMDHSHGSTAIDAVSIYEATNFPEEYRGNAFVGNVMTSRVNRDSLKYIGSTVKAVEEEDFVISEDPWFRPVDTVVGPDGALYIADFYNKIIGHYEVPLQHPGRDRDRGRIWRVTYVGNEANAPVPAMPTDISQSSLSELIGILASDNLSARMRAMDQITDRIGESAVPELKQALQNKQSADGIVSLLWLLQRFKQLPEETLLKHVGHSEERVRLHAIRIIADQAKLSAPLHSALINALKNDAPLIRRAAADAMGRHPHADQVQVLFEQLQSTDKEDVHLIHGIKIALRNQLRDEDNLALLSQQELSKQQVRLLAGVCMGLDSQASAGYLLKAIRAEAIPNGQIPEALTKIARQTRPEDVTELVSMIRSRFSKNLDQQVNLLNSVNDGLRQRGINPQEALKDWALDLTQDLLAGSAGKAGEWRFSSTPPGGANPWDIVYQKSSDQNNNEPFFSSLPGGEQAKGTMRSKNFALPAQLSFYVAGHRGLPGQQEFDSTFVRICLAEGERELFKVLAPRNDVAQKVEWNLSEFAGQQGYIEVVDDLDLNAYAWIAFGRLSPELVEIPRIGRNVWAKQVKDAATLITTFDLKDRKPALVAIVTNNSERPVVRSDAAKAIAKLDNDPVGSGLAGLINSNAISGELRKESAALLVADLTTDQKAAQFLEIVKSIPSRAQHDVAVGLVETRDGSGLLLNYLQNGLISPRILQSNLLRIRLSGSGAPDAEAIVAAIVDNLPSSTAEKDQLITKFRDQYNSAETEAAKGKLIFEQRCSVCHQVAGQGKLIGPQLDGIGTRGLERLLEDILDPNRNVDVAFQSRNYALESGKVHTGMYRRTEGELIIIADNKGEEISFPENEVDVQTTSTVSIMPDNWHETLPEEEILNLVRFLLDQKK